MDCTCRVTSPRHRRVSSRRLSELELECELQVAVVRVCARDLAHRRRPDILVRKSEERRVRQVECVQPELDVEAVAEAIVLHEREIEAGLARSVENASSRIPVGVRRRRHEVIRVEPQLPVGIVEFARAGAVRPARRAIVDAGVQVHGERTAVFPFQRTG